MFLQNRYQVFNAQEYVAMRDLGNNASAPYMAEELTARAKGESTNWQDLMYKMVMLLIKICQFLVAALVEAPIL
jgi:hypothetical protein